jgi:hypothetical protein
VGAAGALEGAVPPLLHLTLHFWFQTIRLVAEVKALRPDDAAGERLAVVV